MSEFFILEISGRGEVQIETNLHLTASTFRRILTQVEEMFGWDLLPS